MGHEVRLIATQYVKPYVKRNKTDAADAEAICEAMQRPGMRFVAIKTGEQQAILSVHRARQGFVRARTAMANQIRGLLAEFGIVLPQGIHNLARVREAMIDQDPSGVFRQLIELQLHHLGELQDRVGELDRQIERWHRDNEASQRLMAIPGVGILTATAVVATVGDARQFRNSRDMAVWLGLTPRQHSTGGKPKLPGMSKRGDVYLRTLMIHGARSALLADSRPESNGPGTSRSCGDGIRTSQLWLWRTRTPGPCGRCWRANRSTTRCAGRRRPNRHGCKLAHDFSRCVTAAEMRRG